MSHVRPRISRRLAAVGALALGLLVAAGGVAVGYLRAQREADRWVQHTYQVLATLSVASESVAEAESAQRAYLLHGTTEDATAMTAAASVAERALGEAHSLTADNPGQQARVDTISRLLDARLRALTEGARARDATGLAGVVRAGPGRERDRSLGDSVRLLVERAAAEEQRLLKLRRRHAAAAAAAASGVTGASILLAALLALGAAALARRDSSARREARRALQESAALARAALNASADAIYILRSVRDSGGRVVDFTIADANARAEAQVRLPRAALVGRLFGEVLPSQRGHGFPEDYVRVVERGVTVDYDRPALDARMAGRWLQIQLAPLGDGVLLSVRDVTDRRRAVEALEERERRYRLMARYFPNGMVALLDRELRFLVADGAGLATIGLTRDDLEGRRVVDAFPPLAVAALAPALEAALAGEEAPAEISLGGRAFATLAAPVRDGAGAVTGALVIAQDVTERAAMERLKGELIATVSHELRTPLTSIRGALGLLEGGTSGPLSEQAATLVRIARSNSERLIRLVNDVLDLEKIEAHRMELRMQTLRAPDVVPAAAEGMQGAAVQAGVRIVQDVSTTRAFVADRDRLLQVLTNLLSNAVKFAPAGSAVVVRAEDAPAGAVRLTVEDGGPGIPGDKLGGLFEKFHQVDASDARARGGTGLGLAITRAIVEQHGGRVGVESEPGVRTAFWCELPAA